MIGDLANQYLHGYLSRSKVVEIPPDILSYMKCDTIILPAACDKHLDGTVKDDDSDDEVDWGKQEDTIPKPCFKVFDGQIQDSINSLGGKVFIKLNWSSTQDAGWILHHSIPQCSSVTDVYLLLKASDNICKDYTEPYKYCCDSIHIDDTSNKNEEETIEENNREDEIAQLCRNTKTDYELVLKKWKPMNTGNEFRCFVRNNELIGISQRHKESYHKYIKEDKVQILQDIYQFYAKHVNKKFPDSSYIFDIIRPKKENIYIIDFSPFMCHIDPLFFSWDELIHADIPSETRLRFIDKEIGVQPMIPPLPQDFIDLSTGADPFKLIDFLKMEIQNENVEDEDE